MKSLFNEDSFKGASFYLRESLERTDTSLNFPSHFSFHNFGWLVGGHSNGEYIFLRSAEEGEALEVVIRKRRVQARKLQRRTLFFIGPL